MAEKSNIQWTDATWNVAIGCSKVDSDCKFCYMYRNSYNGTRYNPKQVTRTKTVFNLPLRYKNTKSEVWDGKPLMFTSSQTDVFHSKIDAYRNEVWEIVRDSDNSIKQILTKRPERILGRLPDFWDEIKHDVWMGTSVGAPKGWKRAMILADTRLKVHLPIIFLSLEPLHQDLTPYLEHLHLFDWVIVGGESGNGTVPEQKGIKYGFRKCELKWIENIVARCKEFGVPVFVKQLGTYLSLEMGLNDRHGGDINEFPEHLRIRQFPATSKGRWVYERSSGYDGYRCQTCATWVYERDKRLCDCDKFKAK